ncbi:MAG TPA: type IX secretion system protein PorQ [Ohtaekwangia sp.]
MLRYSILISFILLSGSVLAQLGGRRSYEFLNVPAHARLAALGGVNTSLTDRDINFFFSNPALVSDTLAGFASASYQFYVGDVGQAGFSYAHDFNRIGMLVFGIQHLNYGTIQGYDASGQETGTFKSGETALVIGKSHQIRHFRFGVNFKLAFSNIAAYRSSAVMLDLGGTFIHPEKDFRVGLVIKNLGFVLSDYSETSDTKLPLDVQAGITFKPEHMPLRFSITAYNLARSDATYYDPASGQDEPGGLNKLLRRFNFGAELLIHRNVNILAGYNYLIHQELKLEQGGGAAGLSFGFSARIKSLEFVFSRSSYVVGNAGYAFTLSTDIDKMLKR